MPKSFSYFDFVAYIFSGFPILLALDHFLLAGCISSSPVISEPGVVVSAFLMFTLALIIGNINSTISHWVFQEGGFSWLFGRPSAHLLGDEKSQGLLRRIKYCEKLPADVIRKIRKRAGSEHEDPNPDHTVLWSLAFRTARFDDWFQSLHEQLLLTVHFSRNMHTSLVFTAAIILLGSLLRTVDMALEVSLTLATLTLVAADLMFIRFLIALRSYSKQVLKHYAFSSNSPEAQRVVRVGTSELLIRVQLPLAAQGSINRQERKHRKLQKNETADG